MQTIVSGSSTERIIRSLITMLVVGGFAAAFLWDGYLGYPRANADALLVKLGMEPDPQLPIRKEITSSVGEEVVTSVRKGDLFEKVTEQLGKPTFEKDRDAYFVGPGGTVAVRRQTGSTSATMRIENIVWDDGLHSDVDLMVQLLLGYTLGVIGLVTLVRFVRTLTCRVTLSESGLSGLSSRIIPFAAMRGFKTPAMRIAQLEYEQNGKTQTVRIDPYDIKEAAAIVDAIAIRIGCDNPHKSEVLQS